MTEPGTGEVARPHAASAAPVRERGLRTRAGNAMGRTRAAVLDGAVRAVEKYGLRKTTMSDIAALAGVAKGTLYNHFRTKDAVLTAALDAAVADLREECAGLAAADLAGALAVAAERLSAHPAVRRVAADEPGALMALVRIGDGPAWAPAREAAAAVLTAAGRDSRPDAVELVLRWVTSHAPSASGDDAIRAGAAILAAGLPVATATSPSVTPPASPPPGLPPAPAQPGVGWPGR